MFPEEIAKKILHILIPIFLIILSIFFLNEKVPETKFFSESIESIDDSKETVLKFSGATLATSVAITLLPDDIATPLADSLADMNKYFIIIMAALFLEKLIVTEGTKIAFLILIPSACGAYIIGYLLKKHILKELAYKIAILGVALVLVVPCSTHLVDMICSDYIEYVNQTISKTETDSEKVHEIMTTTDDDDSALERISNAFRTAMDGIEELFAYFKKMIKECMDSIAILLVTTVAVPIIVLLLFKWLLTELFKIKFPKLGRDKNSTNSCADREDKKQKIILSEKE